MVVSSLFCSVFFLSWLVVLVYNCFFNGFLKCCFTFEMSVCVFLMVFRFVDKGSECSGGFLLDNIMV